MWNCKSSIFLFSSKELRNPALRLENAESSGARIVKPPFFAVMSCEFTLLMISVVFRRRIRTENVFAFLRIVVMSSGTESVESGDSGNVGTNDFGDGAVAFGVGGVFLGDFGDDSGACEMDNVDEKRRKSEKKKKKVTCFIFKFFVLSLLCRYNFLGF